jgi:hypothetical protein
MQPIYIITNITWASGSPYFSNVSTLWEVRHSNPTDSKIFYQTTRCHVAAHAWATWHHPIRQVCHVSNCHFPTSATQLSNQHIPHQHFHVWVHTPTTSFCTDCMDCKVNKFMLVWKNGKNTISHSSDIHLNPFEVCGVREGEAYTPVCFVVIPSNLCFGLNFDP